jgi:monooxygenase
MSSHYDVLIIGAGVSGIGMACQLAAKCPGKRVVILERRKSIGGTWDLFRYPGVRSDSDMLTYGFNFRPWSGTTVFADGPSIKSYLTDTAREHGIDKKIQFGLRIARCEWISAEQRWTVTAVEEDSGNERQFTCGFLVGATGYYNYDQGYLPKFPGVESFKGRFVHPQHWPEGLDYRGKRIVVIGSGATAVTLVPAMAPGAAHVTMLQRSPSYVFSFPGQDTVGVALKRVMPDRWAYALLRRRNILLQRFIYKTARRFPRLARSLLLAGIRRGVGPDFDMSNFSPSYMPWDERLCVVPDGDLFKVLREGKASVVTDQIQTFTECGVALKSGPTLEADIVVAATGLQLQMFGGIELRIDGKVKSLGERMTYKGVLAQDTPNFAYMMGYTNASWTLKIDEATDYVCRVLNEMDRRGVRVVMPRAPSGELQDEGILDGLRAGYVQRGGAVMPRQGRDRPWRVLHHYEKDRVMFRRSIDDPALEWGPSALRPAFKASVAAIGSRLRSS